MVWIGLLAPAAEITLTRSRMVYLLTSFAVAVLLLLWAEWRQNRAAKAVFKVLASTGFVACALAEGATGSAYGRWVLLALALSWLGDVFLLSRGKPLFVAGITSFLLGHLGFVGAFFAMGVDSRAAGATALIVVGIGAAFGRWLLPKVEPGMRLPVTAYLSVISVMVAFGGGAFGAGGPLDRLVAPVAFYLSDMTVARERFVAPGFMNALIGLPLYYGAQILFALSVGAP